MGPILTVDRETIPVASVQSPLAIPVADSMGDISNFVTTLSVSSVAGAIPVGDGMASLAAWGLPKCNYAATSDPDVTAGSTQGYGVGSRWCNTTNLTFWMCISSTQNAAAWIQVSQHTSAAAYGRMQTYSGQTSHFAGQLIHYTAAVVLNAQTISYVRNWLPVGITITKMEAASGTAATCNINMGIYSEASGLPSSLLALTGSTAVTAASSNSFVTVNLLSSWTVPASGYYWFAFSCDSATPTWVASVNLPLVMAIRANRSQTTTGVTLPATAAPISPTIFSSLYTAAVE